MILLLLSLLLTSCNSRTKYDNSNLRGLSEKEISTIDLEKKAYCVSSEFKEAVKGHIDKDFFLTEIYGHYSSSFYGIGNDTCYAIILGSVDPSYNIQAWIVDIFNNTSYQIFIKNEGLPIQDNQEKLEEIRNGLISGSIKDLNEVKKQYGDFLLP